MHVKGGVFVINSIEPSMYGEGSGYVEWSPGKRQINIELVFCCYILFAKGDKKTFANACALLHFLLINYHSLIS